MRQYLGEITTGLHHRTSGFIFPSHNKHRSKTFTFVHHIPLSHPSMPPLYRTPLFHHYHTPLFHPSSRNLQWLLTDSRVNSKFLDKALYNSIPFKHYSCRACMNILDVCIDAWIDGQMNGWMKGQMDLILNFLLEYFLCAHEGAAVFCLWEK